jgi:hypothetical protein
MDAETKFAISFMPLWAINTVYAATDKPRRWIRNHKEALITTAILGTGAACVAYSMKTLSDRVNAPI